MDLSVPRQTICHFTNRILRVSFILFYRFTVSDAGNERRKFLRISTNADGYGSASLSQECHEVKEWNIKECPGFLISISHDI